VKTLPHLQSLHTRRSTLKESDYALPEMPFLSGARMAGFSLPVREIDVHPSAISQIASIRLGEDQAREVGAVTDTRSFWSEWRNERVWTLRCAENCPMGIGQIDIRSTGPYREDGGVPLYARMALPEPPARPASRTIQMAVSGLSVIPPTRPTTSCP
jgi:hypothetical protein